MSEPVTQPVEAAIPQLQTQLAQPSAKPLSPMQRLKAPLTPPKLQETPRQGFLKEETSLDEGSATLVWPETLSADSYYDLAHWVQGILQKAKRRAGIKDTEERNSQINERLKRR